MKYKGQRSIIADSVQPEAFHWSRTGGPSTSFSYQGSWADMFAVGADASVGADSVDISREQGSQWYRCVVAKNGEEVQEVHEVMGSHITQSVLFNSNVQRYLASAGIASNKLLRILAQIQNEANRVKSGQEGLEEAIDNCGSELGYGPEDIPSATEQAFRTIISQLVLGGDQFLQVQWTYRHSFMYAETVWSQVGASVWKPRYANVEAIHTAGQMAFSEGIPESLYLPKAVGVASVLYSNMMNTANPGDECEWLKQAPNVTLTYNQKRSYSVEYLAADKWSRLLYPVYTVPTP